MASYSRRSELLLPARATATPRNAATPLPQPSYIPPHNPYAAFGTPPAPAPPAIPTIRLTTATPAQSSTSGSPLAPRQSSEPRAKLVPKRSKLSLLVSKNKDAQKGRDMSDIMRRVGADGDTSRSFDIYVDPADDPEIGEIVVVQRKKSRVALGDIGWSLNVDSAAQQVAEKVKEPPKEKTKENKENAEEKSNWWTRTMGRGRKDSKEKDEKQRGRSKSPGPFRSLSASVVPQSTGGRPPTQRTHSLDAGLLMSIPTAAVSTASLLTPSVQNPDPFAAHPVFPSSIPPPTRPATPTFGLTVDPHPDPAPSQRSATLSFGSGAYLAPPSIPGAPDKNGSLAIRAMRSVKSLARLGSWAQLRGGDDKENPKQESSSKRDTAKREKRSSKSSKTGSVSSAMALDAKRLSTESTAAPRRNKQSTGAESILSSASGGSADPRRVSTGSSVRWDPSVMDTVRDATRRVSGSTVSTKRSSTDSKTERSKKDKGSKRDTHSHSDARKRGALPTWSDPNTPAASSSLPPPTPPSLTRAQSELHMAVMYAKSFSESPESSKRGGHPNWSLDPQPPTPPIMEVEEDPMILHDTPAKKNRPRPMSEQLLGERHRAALMDEDPLALLNAATSDLASLINRLDLRTPDSTPHTSRTRFSADDLTEPLPSARGSPIRRAATMGLSSIVTSVPGTPKTSQPQQPTSPQSGRGHQISITSLRPYAQSRTPSKRHSGVATTMTVQTSHSVIGQPIIPLPMSPSQLKKDALGTREALPKLRSVGSLSKTSVAAPATPTTESQNTLRGTLKRRSTQMLAAIFSTPELPPRPESPPPPIQPLAPPPPRPALSPATKAKTLRPSRNLSRKDDPAPSASSLNVPPSSNDVNNMSPTIVKKKLVSSRTTPKNDGTIRTPPTTTTTTKSTPSSSKTATHTPASHDITSLSPKLPPGSTFGISRPPSKTLRTPSAAPDTPTPPSTRACGHVRKSSSLVPLVPQKGHARKASGQISLDQRRNLGMKGTLGMGSTGDVELDEGDSDVPDELQTIISSAENTVAFPSPSLEPDSGAVLSRQLVARPTPPSPGPPPPMPPPTPATTPAGTLNLPLPRRISIPVFQAFVGEEGHEVVATSPTDSVEDTKKSFDFTGEIASLSQSARVDGTFVDQLEAAFQTPAKMSGLNFDVSFVPPVPPIPLAFRPSAEASRGAPEPNILDGLDADSLQEVEVTTKTDCGASSEGDEDREDDCVQIQPRMSHPSNGELNRSFRFGNSSPTSASAPTHKPSLFSVDHNLTLGDIIPPPAHVEHVRAASMSDNSDDSVMKSIISHVQPLPHSFEKAVRERLSSISECDTASKRQARQNAYQTLVRGRHGHSPSEASFQGLPTFGDIRNKWEFGMSAQRAAGPPPSSRRRPHARQISEISIASVSDYGVVLNGGKPDPFNLGPAHMMAADEASVAMDDTFDFRRGHVRNPSVDSDRSSFYFRSAPVWRTHHRRNTSVWSNSEMPSFPPPSMYQRTGHKRSDSTNSANSVALAYGNLGANGGRAAWARHRQDPSRDSIMSEFSMVRLGRPGVGDKMFESAGLPLTSIAASPPESVASDAESERRVPTMKPSFETKRTSVDSLFEESDRRSSVSSSSESIFGYGDANAGLQGNLFGHGHLRPYSALSNSIGSGDSTKEDETMFTMLGGGHVRRTSLSSLVDASPLGVRNRRMQHDYESGYEVHPLSSPERVSSPEGRSRIVEKPSYKFGPERMLKAQAGTLSRDSLELSCLSAEGEDMTSADVSVVFSRPMPVSRSRPATILLPAVSGTDTPPLSPSTGSSSGSSNDSQSSIDIERLKLVMERSANSSSLDIPGARLRPRGQGHRRRVSQYSQYSRSNSMIETIQEEASSPTSARPDASFMFPPPAHADHSVVVVDQDIDASDWDEDSWLQALRRYYELHREANEEVETSRKLWNDTPWSIHALQSFQPPSHPAGMKAMLEHSQKTYLPLPFEMRQRRVSLRSRASPYGRTYTITVSPKNVHPGNMTNTSILQELSTNIAQPPPVTELKPKPKKPNTPAPALAAVNPLSPFHFEFLDNPPAVPAVPEPVLAPRQRVPSATRRNALGWSKRSTPKEVKSSNKENAPPSGVVLMSPTESLRISRPRPKGRVTSGQTPAASRGIGVKA